MKLNRLHFYFILSLFLVFSCIENKQKKITHPKTEVSNSKEPFRMPKYKPFTFKFDYYNLTGEERLYKLTNDSLFVFNLKLGKNPVFKTDNLPIQAIKKIEDFNIYDFKSDYTNHRILDGIQIRIEFTKQELTKEIFLRNYYHAELSPIIEMINGLVPLEHTFWYEKKWIVSKMSKYNTLE